MNFHFVFLLLVFPLILCGQSQNNDFLTLAMLSGDSLFNEKDYEPAILKYEEVVQISAKQNDWDKYLQAGFMKAQCFQKTRQVPKAIKLSNDLIAKVEKRKDQSIQDFRGYLAQTRSLLLHHR